MAFIEILCAIITVKSFLSISAQYFFIFNGTLNCIFQAINIIVFESRNLII